MADVFRLANEAQSSTVNLLSGTLKLKEKSWHTMAARPKMSYATGRFGGPGRFVGYDKVIESFSLVANDTVANTITAIIALEDVAAQVRAWQDGQWYADTWWLEWNADGESAKRSLIHSITLDYPSSVPAVNSFIEEDKLEVRVVLERAPLWETVDTTTINAGEAISTCGGTYEFGSVPGTELARIAIAAVVGDDPADEITDIWMGIRPTHAGLDDFDPVWECEDGTIDDTDDTSDEGTYIRVDFANDATLDERRWHMDINAQNQSGPDDDHFAGRYLVLARTRVSAGTCGLQMRSGYTDNIVHEEIYIDSTDWVLRPLGQIAIPGSQQAEYISSIGCRFYTLSLYAEQVSDDAGTLDVDCLITIPSEHMIYMSGTTTDDGDIVGAYTTADDQVFCLQSALISGYVDDSIAVAINNWYLPLDGGMIVIAATGEAHEREDAVWPILYYNARWRSYRGDAAST